MAVPILTRRLPAPARQARPQGQPRSPKDRLLDVLAAAAGVWAAVALLLAVLVALAVTLAFILVIGVAVASAAPRVAAAPVIPSAAMQRVPRARTGYQEPQATAGAGSAGGVRNAGSASRSSASSGAAAAASLAVSGGRFHLLSISFSTDV